MSVLDKFLDIMRLNDDDYDDEYDETDSEDYEYEEKQQKKESRSAGRRERRETRREQRSEQRAAEQETAEKPQKTNSKITPISKSRRQVQQPGMEVCVIKPNTIEDEREIVETLLNGRTVVLNMEGLSVDMAQRIIDFTSGATFAMYGNLQKISTFIFLATPSGVDISGDIQDLMDSFDFPGFTM